MSHANPEWTKFGGKTMTDEETKTEETTEETEEETTDE